MAPIGAEMTTKLAESRNDFTFLYSFSSFVLLVLSLCIFISSTTAKVAFFKEKTIFLCNYQIFNLFARILK